VLAELANNTQINGKHIADLLSEHNGQYAGVMANYLGVAANAATMISQIGEPPLMAHL
jgi:hypothetical protein